jgi:uncharacterized protein (UPF0276 family)
MTSHRHVPNAAGVGLRLPHLAEVVATRPRSAWFEIHPENFLANPHATELLLDLARDYPISVHTVGVSVGSASGVDRAHLARVRALVDALDPVLVSGHLAWSTHEGDYLNDLLPLPYDDDSLRLICAHVDEVQEALGRCYLVENPSSYVGFGASTMNEAEFLGALARRTSCKLLCDVSNIYLSAHNMGFDRYAYLDALPPDAIGELHLGGFEAEDDEASPGGNVFVDTHSARIAEPVWDFYADALRRFGAKPTMIEWDNDIPPFATLMAEAARADAVAGAALVPEQRRASAR